MEKKLKKEKNEEIENINKERMNKGMMETGREDEDIRRVKGGPACCFVTRVEMGGVKPKGLNFVGNSLSGLLVPFFSLFRW